MINKKIVFVSIFTMSSLAISLVSARNRLLVKNDAIHQVSSMHSFIHGAYDSVVTLEDLKSREDTGFGTFDGANNENDCFAMGSITE